MTEPRAVSVAPAYGVIDHYLSDKGREYFGWQRQPGILQGLWNRHLWSRYIRPQDEVLDFGCGGGFLLTVLDARGKTGVEINPHAAQAARQLGIAVYSALSEVPGSFDRIITSHVLEHIPHPRQAIIELRDKLRDEQSRLLILLPLDDWRNRANRHYASTDRNMHLQAWTPQTLGNLLASAGLDVLTVRVVREAWPPASRLLWKISPRVFRLASFVWALVAKRYQLFAVCRRPTNLSPDARGPRPEPVRRAGPDSGASGVVVTFSPSIEQRTYRRERLDPRPQHRQAAPHQFADLVVVVTSVLLLLSTIQSFGAEREAVASAATIDPLAFLKIGVRLVALMASGYLWRVSPGSLRALGSGPTVWFLAFFGVATLTALVSVNPFVSASRAISFAIVLIFATSAAAMYVRQGREAVYWRGVCLLLLATTVPLFGVVLWRGRVVESYDTVARLGGIYQPNQLGALAGIVLLTAITCLHRGRLVLLSVCMLPVALSVAILTLSRGSWIAIAVGLLAAWLSVRKLRIWALPFLAILVTSTALGFATGTVDSDRGLIAAARRGQTPTELLSGTGRTGLYSYILTRQFPKRPLLGFGFQMLSDEDVATYPKPEETAIARALGWPAEQAHNLFLSTLVGTGLIGLSLFLVAIGSLLRRVGMAARSGDPIAADQLVLVTVILVHAFLDTTLVTGVDHAFIIVSAVAGLASARLALNSRLVGRPVSVELTAPRPPWLHSARTLGSR